jgi:hypothetical protein
MKITIVEGTPAEVAEAFPGLFAEKTLVIESNESPKEVEKPLAKPAPEQTSGGTVTAPVYVTKAVAQAMLRRRPLAAEQRAVIKEIYSAHPKAVLATELQKKVSYSTAQFAGLMGAFGRRLTHTPGFVPHTRFFAQEWDHVLGCYRYGLPDTVRGAVAEETWAK